MKRKDTVYRWKVVDTYGRQRGYILGRDPDEVKDKLQNLKERNKWAKGLESFRIVIDAENIDDVLANMKANLRAKNICFHKRNVGFFGHISLYQSRLKDEEELDTYTKAVNAIRKSENRYNLQMEGGDLH